MCTHHVQQGERGAEVIGVVLNRLSNGFSNGLEARKMNNAIDMVGIKDTIEFRAIIDIGFVKRPAFGILLAHNGFNTVDDFFRRVGKIVNDNRFVAAIEQLNHRMAANESGASGNEDAGVFWIFLLAHTRPLL